MWRVIWLGVIASASSLGGCTDEQPLGLGAQCELNSECDAPLVCRFERCRKACVTDRDCALGLHCYYDQEGQGACQLPEETFCDNHSDCPGGLRCPMGECVALCVADRCPPNATCEPMGADEVCVFPSDDRPCIYNSDCPFGELCVGDGVCRVQCAPHLPCRGGQVCVGIHRSVDGGMGCDYFCEDPGRTESSPECAESAADAGG